MSSPIFAMLSNFKKRYLFDCSPPQQEQQSLLSLTESEGDAPDTDYPDQMNDAVAQRHWGSTAMADTIDVAGSPCPFYSRHTEIDDESSDSGRVPMRSRSRSHDHHSLPSTRSVVQVLYPPSYLGNPRPFPDPPSYSPSNSLPYPDRGDDAETSPLITTTTNVEGTSLSPSRPDPLAQDPSLTGVPSQGAPSSRILPVEPSPPIIALGRDVSEETEPLPAYSRFDQRRPRFPAASDVLGPYPPLSALREASS